MQRTKYQELINRSEDELLKEVHDLREKLAELKSKAVTAELKTVHHIKVAKRNIAKILTELKKR